MHRLHPLRRAAAEPHPASRRRRTTYAAAAVAIFVVLGAGVAAKGRTARSEVPAVPAATTASVSEAQRFLLNALLVPALDADAVPLRWVDPRPAARCGPATRVLVNGAPLRPGAPVPDDPFELDWHADGCRPFAATGARLDGSVRLTVFREDWGFSAIVEPSGLRLASSEDVLVLQRRSVASLPRTADAPR